VSCVRDADWFGGVVELSVRPDLIPKLVPPHFEEALRLRSIDIHNFKPIPLEQLRITLD
jgi:glycogen synthase kinase 3 beta